jgi:hypothetical protein
MTRRYDGPRLTGGKVHYPGKAGQLNQAKSPGTPKFEEERPAPIASPYLGRGEAPAPKFSPQEPKHSVMKAPENPQPASEGGQRGSDTLMVKPDPNSPVNRRKAQIMRERAQEARATRAQGLAQQQAQEKQQAQRAPGGPPPAPPSAQGAPGQPLGKARRGFGRT